MSSYSSTPENIDWQWDDTAPGVTRGQVVLEAEEGNYFVFTGSEPDRPVELKRARMPGDPVWVRHLPNIQANSAALLLDAGQLYAALYLDGATGGHVIALEATSGKVRWAILLEGVGPILHSKYRNRIQMRFINKWLVVFGDESGGKYIEVLDPENGQRLSNRVVQP
jgi:outer membrane protein assembly factor BamB